jgi:hypothetical protein
MYLAMTRRAAAAFTRAPGPAEAEGWRPIESAPKDGTPVDLWMSRGYRVTDAHWGEMEPDDDGEDWPDHAWFDDHGDMVEGEDNRATHWRPVPDAPADETPNRPEQPAEVAGRAALPSSGPASESARTLSAPPRKSDLDLSLDIAHLIEPRSAHKMAKAETVRMALERADWVIARVRAADHARVTDEAVERAARALILHLMKDPGADGVYLPATINWSAAFRAALAAFLAAESPK